MNRATRRSAKAEIRLDAEEGRDAEDHRWQARGHRPGRSSGQRAACPQQAAHQIRARRQFKISTASAAVGVTLLVPIWAATEYRNAGGWPARGFSQRSGIPRVWNIWIIYPFLAYALMTAGHGWFVYGRNPTSESQTDRKITLQAGGQRPSDP